MLAVRGERLLSRRLEIGTADIEPRGAAGRDCSSYSASTMKVESRCRCAFDVEDIDAAVAELDAAHARFEKQRPRTSLENAASRAVEQRVHTPRGRPPG